LLSGLRLFWRWRGRQGNLCFYVRLRTARLISTLSSKRARGLPYSMSRIRPAKIKTAASVAVKTLGAFDFVCLLNDQAELIRFRDSLQLGACLKNHGCRDLHGGKRSNYKLCS